MTILSVFERISRAISEGNFQEALALAESIEDEVDKTNAIGIVHYYSGRIDEAIIAFEEVLRKNPFHPATLFNLAKIRMETSNYGEAWRLLLRMPEKVPASLELLGDVAKALGNLPLSVYYYRLAVAKGATHAANKLSEIFHEAHKDLKISVFAQAGAEYFARELVDLLSSVFIVRLVVPKSAGEMVEAFEWSDVVWFEGVSELLAELSNKRPKGDKKVIVRIFEPAGDALVEKVNWFCIDHVVLVNDEVRRFFEERYEEVIHPDRRTIEKCVNLVRIGPSLRRSNNDVALIPDAQQLTIINLLELARELSKGTDYRFFLKLPPTLQPQVLRVIDFYVKKHQLESRFFLATEQENFYEFLSNKSTAVFYTLSGTVEYPIIISMAMGVRTFVFEADDEIKNRLPEECRFASMEEAVLKVRNEESRLSNLVKQRVFVEDNYSIEVEANRIIELIQELPDQEFLAHLLFGILSEHCSQSGKETEQSEGDGGE